MEREVEQGVSGGKEEVRVAAGEGGYESQEQ